MQGRSLTEVTRDINARLATGCSCRPGYRITQGGEARDQAEVFARIFTALGVAVLLMYLILVVQFGSFLDPLAILVSLPLSLIGVVLALHRHRRHAQHHEPDRGHPADGHRGQERHPADRLRQVVARDGACRCARR